MSNNINSVLFDRASEMITYFEGKLPAKVIEADLDRNDLEALQVHVANAEAVAAQEQMHGWEIA